MAAEPKKVESKQTSNPARNPTHNKSNTEDKKKRIYRAKSDRMIGGVCAGVAQHFNIDVTVVRVVWAIAVIWGGVGLVAYILGWIIVPENPDSEQSSDKAECASNSGLVWGVILLAFGCLFLVRQLDLFDFRWYRFRHIGNWWPGHYGFGELVLPILIILVGIVYLVSAMKKGNPESARAEKPAGGKSMDKKLTRSATDKMVGGVCGGVATYFNMDPSIVRVLWAVLTLAGGGLLGVIAYVAMLIIVPEESAAVQSTGTESKASKAVAAKAKK